MGLVAFAPAPTAPRIVDPLYLGSASEFFPESYGATADGVHDDTAAIQAAHNAAAAKAGAKVVFRGLNYKIQTSKITWGTAPNTHWEGIAHFASKITQNTLTVPIVDVNVDNTYGCSISNMHLAYVSTATNADAYGWQCSVPGSTAQGVFQWTFHNFKVSNAYRGWGINKSSGSATVWDIHFSGSCYFMDCSDAAIYWKNPTATGSTNNTAETIYVQNPAVTSTAVKVHLEAVDIEIQTLNGENISSAKTLLGSKFLKIDSAHERTRIGNLHFENITFVTASNRLIDVTSTGPVSIGHLDVKASVINVAAGGDAYFIVPGGGTITIDSLYYQLTNTGGVVAVVASGTGLVKVGYVNPASTGTFPVTHSWDTAAQAFVNWPIYQAFTPVTTQSGTVTSYTINDCYYQQVGKQVHFYGILSVNNAGTAASANDVTISLPIPAAFRSSRVYDSGNGHIFDSSADDIWTAIMRIATASTMKFHASPTNASVASGIFLGTILFTAALASADQLVFDIKYEAA